MSGSNHYEKIEEMVRQLRRTTDSQLDGKILDDTFAAFDEAMPRSMILRVFVFRMVKIAAAVVILFVLATAAQKYFAQQNVQPHIAQAAKNEIVAVIDDSNKTVILSPPAGTATATRDTVKLQEELKQVIQLISANDTNGLAKMLSGAKAESRLAAVIYLANMDSRRSIEILDILSDKLNSKEPDNLFAVTSAVLKKRLEDKKRESNQPLPDEKKSKKDEIVIKCVLSGFVTSAETGKPVSDVNICLEGRSAACTITDVNGFYCFDKAGEEGEYRIAIHSKEYVDPCSDNPKLMVLLRNDSNVVENLMLIPACMINIQVVNEANEPVKGAFVYETWSVSYEDPNKESYRFATAGHTNEKGEVSLGGFESSETPRLFIAAYNDYAPESLTLILNNHLTTPFYRIVVKKGQDTKADSNQPLP